jgi:hypothetical protein
LDWFLNAPSEQRSPCSCDFQFLKALAHLVTAENQEEVIFRWLVKEMQSHAADFVLRRYRSARDNPLVRELSFFGRLVGQVVEAQLARSIDRRADIAPRTYLKLRGLQLRFPAARAIQVPAASTKLTRILKSGHYTETDPDLYDQHIHDLRLQVGSFTSPGSAELKDETLQEIAWLELHHPSTPSTKHALDFLGRLNNDENHRKIVQGKWKSLAAANHLARDTVQLLREHGRGQEADRVKDFRVQYLDTPLEEPLQARRQGEERNSRPSAEQFPGAIPGHVFGRAVASAMAAQGAETHTSEGDP